MGAENLEPYWTEWKCVGGLCWGINDGGGVTLLSRPYHHLLFTFHLSGYFISQPRNAFVITALTHGSPPSSFLSKLEHKWKRKITLYHVHHSPLSFAAKGTIPNGTRGLHLRWPCRDHPPTGKSTDLLPFQYHLGVLRLCMWIIDIIILLWITEFIFWYKI